MRKFIRLKLVTAFILCLFFVFSPVAAAQKSAKTAPAENSKNKTTVQTHEKTKSEKQNSGKSGHSRKHSKRRHRRGSASYTSSAESEETRRKIAAETQRLELEPDLSGDEPDLEADKLVWPLNYGYVSRGVRKGHRGVDMMAYAGDSVYAVADGVVERVIINDKKYRGYGKIAIIYHEDKQLWSWYSHCSAIYLYEGQVVKRGQKIAAVGRTGRATCNHLHFELRGAGNKVLNPWDYLPEQGALGRKYVPH